MSPVLSHRIKLLLHAHIRLCQLAECQRDKAFKQMAAVYNITALFEFHSMGRICCSISINNVAYNTISTRWLLTATSGQIPLLGKMGT